MYSLYRISSKSVLYCRRLNQRHTDGHDLRVCFMHCEQRKHVFLAILYIFFEFDFFVTDHFVVLWKLQSALEAPRTVLTGVASRWNINCSSHAWGSQSVPCCVVIFYYLTSPDCEYRFRPLLPDHRAVMCTRKTFTNVGFVFTYTDGREVATCRELVLKGVGVHSAPIVSSVFCPH